MTSPPQPPLDLLILGGTKFLGPALVRAAWDRGHTVTLFNRGRTDPRSDVETLIGDRDPRRAPGLEALATAVARGRTWDAVIDPSAHVPRLVTAAATLLAPAVAHAVYVSSISVYADFSVVGLDESAPVRTMDDETIEDFGPAFENYGALKALSEQAAAAAMPGRVTVVRPGFIVGPRDDSDRFTYWPERVRRGGAVLAPGDGRDPVQIVDVRDLAAFIVRCCEQRDAGTFNATGPEAPLTMDAMLTGIHAVTGGDARLTWVPASFLEAHEASAALPIWAPADGPTCGLMTVGCRPAFEAGLATRPLADTVEATLAWFRSLPAARQGELKAGLTPARERELLSAWSRAR